MISALFYVDLSGSVERERPSDLNNMKNEGFCENCREVQYMDFYDL